MKTDRSFANQSTYDNEVQKLTENLHSVLSIIDEAKDTIEEAINQAKLIGTRLDELSEDRERWYQDRIKKDQHYSDTGLLGEDEKPLYIGSPVKIKRATRGQFKGVTRGTVVDTTDKDWLRIEVEVKGKTTTTVRSPHTCVDLSRKNTRKKEDVEH